MGRTSGGERTKLSLIKCGTYNHDDLIGALRKCVSPFLSKDPSADVKPKVLLKINLLSPNKGPDKPVNTHPEFVKALAKIFADDYGCEVFVGDSCSSFSQGSTNKAFKNMGLDALSAEGVFKIINVDTSSTVTVRNEDNTLIKEIKIPAVFKDMDLIVSVPKLKTHELTGYTGALKNMLGAVPGKLKRDVHVMAPTSKKIAEALCDIYALVKPHFAVMDGIVGMEGNGPSAGSPVNTGLVLASDDPVSLDAVAAHLVGFRHGEVRTTIRAHERGLGNGDLTEIDVEGDRIEDCVYRGFKKPDNTFKLFLENIIPSAMIGKMIDKTVTYKPYIDSVKCVRCFECVKGCPVNCIDDDGKKLVIDKHKCIECFCCQEVCPENAVVVMPPLAKIMLGKVQKWIEQISG